MRRSQHVPRHAKTSRRKHFFAELIVGEGTRLTDQRINNVPIVDGRLLLAGQPWHRLNDVALMRHRDEFGANPHIDLTLYQATGNRIRVGSHFDRAAEVDGYVLLNIVRVESFGRQRNQVSHVVRKLLLSIDVGSLHNVFHECNVLFTRLEVPTAAQQQRLIDAIFEMSVGRFDITVFVSATSVRALRFAFVMVHQTGVTFGEFATTRMISHGRRQRIGAMPQRHATELPERFLNARAQCFKRLRKTKRHTFDVAVRQHAVIERVIESIPGDLHVQLITDREVTGRPSPRMMILAEEDRLARTMKAPPLRHAAFESSPRGIGKLTFVSLLQPLEQSLRFEPWFGLQSLLHVVPNVGERIFSCAVFSTGFPLRREPVVVAIIARRFLTHFGHPCRIRQRPAQPEQPPKLFDVSILDHRNLHENQELQ